MYQLSFLSSAKKEFKKLDKVAQKLIKKKLLLLCEDPTKLKNNLKPLKGKFEGKFRLRVNSYRIILQKKDNIFLIIVMAVGHRKEIYKSLKSE